MSFEKELLGFYVTGHPLDAYAPLFASGKYQAISSLGELADRATFTIAGAIAQVDRKFTKKEGKPFAVVFLEDLTGTLEVVLWNETYVPVADKLEPGTVIAIRGTLDKRDDTVRATAQKVKMLTPESAATSARPATARRPMARRGCAKMRRSRCASRRGSTRMNCEPCAKSWLPRPARSPSP